MQRINAASVVFFVQTELAHKGSKFYKGGVKVNKPAAGANGVAPGSKLKCSDCQAVMGGPAEAQQHAKKTGHKNFEQVK